MNSDVVFHFVCCNTETLMLWLLNTHYNKHNCSHVTQFIFQKIKNMHFSLAHLDAGYINIRLNKAHLFCMLIQACTMYLE